MNILLINANPVVSRLLVLCTRDDEVTLTEVSVVEEVNSDDYDIVLVDDASFGQDVAEFLLRFSIANKVFLSYKDEEMNGFNTFIKKPFLPSQILNIIQDTLARKEELEVEDSIVEMNEILENEIPPIFPLTSEKNEEKEAVLEYENEDDFIASVLDGSEIEKIKALLDMGDEAEEKVESLSEEELEARKVTLIKEQLEADGLEIIKEDEIVEELSIGLDGTLKKAKEPQEKKSKPKSKKKKSKSKKPKFTEENMELIEDAVEMVMASMSKKQMKKLLKGKEIEVNVKLEDND